MLTWSWNLCQCSDIISEPSINMSTFDRNKYYPHIFRAAFISSFKWNKWSNQLLIPQDQVHVLMRLTLREIWHKVCLRGRQGLSSLSRFITCAMAWSCEAKTAKELVTVMVIPIRTSVLRQRLWWGLLNFFFLNWEIKFWGLEFFR